jgi:predicted transcriptional regulator
MSISSLDVLEAISDQISVNILNAIAKDVTKSENLMQLLNLTRKRYYDRSTRLLNTGLIRRENGKFYLTSLGQLVHQSQLKIASALEHSSELRAIDALRSDPEMSEDQDKSLIDNLIDDPELKRLITLT